MGPGQRGERRESSSSGGRRRVLAFAPLTVLLLATALAVTGGVAGWPRLGTGPSSPARDSTASAPSAAAPSSGPTGIVLNVGESGSAISTCLCATSESALQHVGTRTTSESIAIRIFTQSVSPPPTTTTSPGSGTNATEQPGCNPTELVQAEISDAQAVTEASGGLYGAAKTTTVVASGEWGLSEGSPAAWVIVSVPASVDLVVASFGDGTSDSMAPIDGLAVLAARVPSESATAPGVVVRGTVAAFDSNGIQVGSVPMEVGVGGNLELPPNCRPQLPAAPTLPKPGPQPAHVSSARKAVRKAFDTLYSAEPDSVKFVYLQGGNAQVGKAGKAAAGTTPEVAAKSLPVVKEVVFTTGTHAAVRYQIDYDGSPVVGPRIGHAVLVGRVWKVTLATYCGVIDGAGTGVTC
jgi:hypothetical protein